MNMTAHIFGKCQFNSVQSSSWIGCVDCGALSFSTYAALLKRENPEPGGCPIH